MLLVEYAIEGGFLLSASFGAVGMDCPETSACCIVEDEETAKAIWLSHTNGGAVVIAVGEDGLFISADIEEVTPIEPEPAKTPEQIRIEQLEAENARMSADFNTAVMEIWETILG